MAVVPYTFADQVGQIPLSELDANFANVKAFAETAGNVTGNVQANITAVGTLTTLSVSGNVIAPRFVGNVTGNVTGSLTGNVTGTFTGTITAPGANTQILFNDAGVANAVAALTFDKSANTLLVVGGVTSASVFATGNITGGNVIAGTLTSGNISSSGNLIVAGNTTLSGTLTGGNISLTGNLTASGNTALAGTATAVTAANGTNTTQIATTAFVANAITNSALPSGVILLWSGNTASIPSGWALCNGSSGTPDLRDRFVVGAGGAYAVGATGGSADAVVVSHTHTANSVVSDPGHTHVNGSFTELLASTGTGTVTSTNNTPGEPQVTASASLLANTTGITVSTTIASTGSSGTNANLPPYYALAYIMKL